MAVTRSKEDALKMIKEFRERLLVNPKQFAEIAKKESDCSSHSTGGDLGYFVRGRMQPEFEKAAFELGEGEISLPVETKSGFHLILRVN